MKKEQKVDFKNFWLHKDREENNKRFRQYTIEVLEKALKIFQGSKNHDYNSGRAKVIDYFPWLSLSVQHDTMKKALRDISLTDAETSPQNESIEDTDIDEILYTAMRYAAHRLEKELGIKFVIREVRTSKEN